MFGLVVLLTTACEKVETVTPFELQEDPLVEVIRIAQEGAMMLEDATTRTSVARRIDRGRISCKVNPATRVGESDDTLYYVVNYADNAGFAIVSANEDAPDGARLIAVTESGNYTAGEKTDNEGFNMYMELVETSYNSARGLRDTILVPDNSHYEDVVTYSPWYGVNPLVQVKWGQGNTDWWDEAWVPHKNEYNPAYPYNKYCYKIEGDSICPAGCVAVAVAQIMSYHQVPENYVVNFDGSNRNMPLNWSDMSTWIGGDDYVWTPSSGDAIALWFREIGHDLTMEYRPQGSGTYDTNVNIAMFFMGYKPSTLVDYDYDVIKTELLDYRPVYMSGDRQQKKDDGTIQYFGHAWVADGYKRRTCQIDTYKVTPSPFGDGHDRRTLYSQVTEEHEYVHYNWGYDGDCNGFFQAGSFQLNYARPEAGGYDNVEANNNMNRSYHYNVKMIIGIEPNE